jgi:integrase
MSGVFKRKRIRDGKKISSRTYYSRIGGKTVNLGVTDKQTAELIRARMIRDNEREAEGLIPSKAVRDSQNKSTIEHLEMYLAELDTLGRDDEHLKHVRGRLNALIKKCSWSTLNDIEASSFEAWRRKQTLSPKTLNEYLSAAHAFSGWLVKRNYLPMNPFVTVERVDARGTQIERRALSLDELSKLFEHSGENRSIYLVAVYTGLRRNEIESLRWGDLDFECVPPCFRVRASTTKNKRLANIPMHHELVQALQALRPLEALESYLVFPAGLPRMRKMREDFDAAGIPAMDSQGRKADFHSLRKTFNMLLQNSGATFATTMNLMRHSDPRLTAKTYMDASLLPQAEMIGRLPSFNKKGTRKGTQKTVSKGKDMSAPVHLDSWDENSEPLDLKAFSPEMAPHVPNCPEWEMVEAGGIEPPSEYESRRHLRV